MRIITFVVAILALSSISLNAQFNGKCGDFRYTIDGKLISSVTADFSGTGASSTVKTYYKVDALKGYIWFWTEEYENNSQQVATLVTMWARLADLDSTSFQVDLNNPTKMLIHLAANQNFFFTTTYTKNKQGPQYGVLNKFTVRFKNDQEANSFSLEARNNLPPKFL